MDARGAWLVLLAAVTAVHGHQDPCAKPDKHAVCKVEGSTIRTFDGTYYSYDTCSHILVHNTPRSKWEIVVKIGCENGKCRKMLVITQNGRAIKLKTDLTIDYAGFTYTIAQAHTIGSVLQEFTVTRNGNGVYFTSLLYGFWVNFDQLENIKIGAPEEMKHRLLGLCGKFNSIPEDDSTRPDGSLATVAQDFGDSWRIPGTTDECKAAACSTQNHQQAYEICTTMTKKMPLSLCSDVISVDFCLNRCIEDLCGCLQTNRVANCRCEAIQVFMKKCQAKLPGADLSAWRVENNCQHTCPPGTIWRDCYRRQCEPSCGNLHNKDACPEVEDLCYSGCFCPEGLVRKGDKCVKPQDCKDCICEGWGDPHYTTFDKSVYDFQGKCTYIASRDRVVAGDKHTFQVLVTNKECGQAPGLTCTEAVTVLYGEHVVDVRRTEGKTILTTRLDGRQISNFPLRNEWLVIETMKDQHFTIYIPQIQLEVNYYYAHYKFVIRLSSHLFNSNLEGLCGNCNEQKFDDFSKKDGVLTTNVIDFGMSWLVKKPPSGVIIDETCKTTPPPPPVYPPTCVPGYPVAPQDDPCLWILDSSRFGKCHHLIDPRPYVEACQVDMCHTTNRPPILCAAASAYAQACLGVGICLNWRRDDFCPYKCPTGKVYKPCGTGCEVTCHNFQFYKKHPDACGVDETEGCFCPDGLVSKGGKCGPPEQCKDCTCTGWGDPHYTTFDGTPYDFQGICTYVASRDKIVDGGKHTYEVLVVNNDCALTGGAPGTTCTDGVIVLYDGHVIYAMRDEGRSQVATTLDGKSVTTFPIQTEWLTLTSAGNQVTIFIPEINLEVSLLYAAFQFTIKLSSHQFADDVEGLCGNCNGDRGDDFTTIQGEVATSIIAFGMSWLATEVPPGVEVPPGCNVPPPPPPPPPPCKEGFPMPPEKDPCNWMLDIDKFGECHHIIDPAEYVKSCQFDMCHTMPGGRDKVKCTAVEAYVEACKGKGVCIEWRTDKFCPFNCPAGMVYKACGTGCHENCDNFHLLRRPNGCNLEDVEGCYCPEGFVLEKGVCMNENDCNACEHDNLDCTMKELDPETTIGLVSELNERKQRCVNKEPIPMFKQCHGFCESQTRYSTQLSTHITEGKCCQPLTYTSVAVVLTCPDESQFVTTVKMPTTCSCNSCEFCHDEHICKPK